MKTDLDELCRFRVQLSGDQKIMSRYVSITKKGKEGDGDKTAAGWMSVVVCRREIKIEGGEL